MPTVYDDYSNPMLNIFLMMRFDDTDFNNNVRRQIAQVCTPYGLNVLRADQKSYYHSLWDNIEAYMNACALDIAVFDNTDRMDFNPNVSLEVGYMIAKGARLLLLKEKSLPIMPADIVGYLYKEFDRNHISTISTGIAQWLVGCRN